jgi:ABC-type multidrug transport system fused ATPase/permease subunit
MGERSERKDKGYMDFGRALGFLAPYRRMVITSIACAVLAGTIMTTGIGFLLPISKMMVERKPVQVWVQEKVDAAQPTVPLHLRWGAAATRLLPDNQVKTIAILFVAVAIYALIGNIVRFIHELYSNRSAICAVNDIRRKLYDHVLHIPLSFFGLKGTSDVTSRLVQDAQILQDGMKTCLGQGILEPIRALLALCFAMWLDWRLTVFVILFVPVAGAVILSLGRKMRRASRAALQSSAELLGQIEGSLAGIRVVKAAGAERFERRRYTTIIQALRREQFKMVKYEALSTPVMETFTMLLAGAILIYAAYLIFGQNVARRLDPSYFMGIVACLIVMGESLRRLSKLNSVIQRSNAAAARIFETLDVPIERPRVKPTVQASADRQPTAASNDGAGREKSRDDGRFLPQVVLPPLAREVRFESVGFSYHNTSSPAVDDVDLVVPKGRSVAVVGRNGSGKTTLLALLPRFYDPQQGRITIDGTDIRKATLRSLRKQIGIVTQDSVIFPGTIAQNIAYGDPRPLDRIRDQIESAARRAFAHDFIMEKPQGYDTPLDGLGGQLSGGQKQRLNIARAILRAAPILILDEATSQVDAESEHLIQQAIETLMHERTTFVIAHRLNTVLSADQIVVMDRGRIVGAGRHDELLRTCDTYQSLYERQLVTAG